MINLTQSALWRMNNNQSSNTDTTINEWVENTPGDVECVNLLLRKVVHVMMSTKFNLEVATDKPPPPSTFPKPLLTYMENCYGNNVRFSTQIRIDNDAYLMQCHDMKWAGLIKVDDEKMLFQSVSDIQNRKLTLDEWMTEYPFNKPREWIGIRWRKGFVDVNGSRSEFKKVPNAPPIHLPPEHQASRPYTSLFDDKNQRPFKKTNST